MSSILQKLELGRAPRVVGTIITEEFLRRWTEIPSRFSCDLVEMRVDGFPTMPGWLEIGKRIEEYDTPVFATLRLAREGGKWTGADQERWPAIESALYHLSGADVEIESELADVTARLAADQGKLCILSYHNFQITPPGDVLRGLISKAHDRGAIGKVAVTVNTEDDLASLQALLAEEWPLPICVIGMGPLGRPTRLEFPRLGSCFTYGYLDQAGAPGQYSAAELSDHLRRAEPPQKSGV